MGTDIAAVLRTLSRLAPDDDPGPDGGYLSTPEHRVQVQLTHGRQMESVRQERVLAS